MHIIKMTYMKKLERVKIKLLKLRVKLIKSYLNAKTLQNVSIMNTRTDLDIEDVKWKNL